MIDREVITRKLRFMQESLDRLLELQALPQAEFDRDFRNVDSALHRLQVCIEAGMDALSHVVSQRRLAVPANDRETITALEHAGLIPVEHAARYKQMVQFRKSCICMTVWITITFTISSSMSLAILKH